MTDRECAHCEAVAMETLEKWAVKVHHDGVFNTVAVADIAGLIARERAAVRAEARREALEDAAKVADEFQRIHEHRAQRASRQIDAHQYADGYRKSAEAAECVARSIRSLLSTDPLDTQGDGGRR